MKILSLGGAGKICREAVFDLTEQPDLEKITIADVNEAAGREIVEGLGTPRVGFVRIVPKGSAALISLIKQYDIVMEGTPISMNDWTTSCIAEAGVHGINLNGMSHEWDLDGAFREHGKTMVPGSAHTTCTPAAAVKTRKWKIFLV